MKKIVYVLGVFLMVLFFITANVQKVFAKGANEVETLIESLEVGEPVYYESLTIIPIYTTKVKDLSNYTTLDEALKNDWLKVTELQGGQVPQLSLTNLSDNYIYIMGGEILSGCKQDRIVGRDVLVRPRSKNLTVPVYCVEQGRWTYQSDKFYSKQNLGTHTLRAEAQYGGGTAQYEIWDKISKSVSKNRVNSKTDAYQDIYETEEVKRKIIPYEQQMRKVPRLYEDTIGVVVGVGNKIVSVDIFANPYIFKKLWSKLLKSSALSAITCKTYGSITSDDAVNFLRILHNEIYTQKPGIDLGFEFYSVEDININALVYRNAVIHLAAFYQEEKEKILQRNNSERRMPVMKR